MPHSAGGGHSSSSSHSSSHSSYHSSSSSSYSSSSSRSYSSSSGSRSGGFSGGSSYTPDPHRISRERYPGSHRYSYRPFFGMGRPRYVYSAANLTDKSQTKKKGKGCAFIAYIVFMLFLFLLVYVVVSPSYCDSGNSGTPFVHDRAEVIGDPDMLTEALDNFYNETGVIPVVYTVYDSRWNDSYDSLESYAYDCYVGTFDDEYHWLLTISMEDDSPTGALEYNIMRGDYTEDAIQDYRIKNFRRNLTEYLGEYDIDEAIARSFDEMRAECTSLYIKGNYGLYTLSFIILLMLYVGMNTFVPKKYIADE